MDKNDKWGKENFTYAALISESFENTDLPNGGPDVGAGGRVWAL